MANKLGAESTENFSSTLGNQDDRINSNTTKELNADPVTVKNVKEELNASKPQPVTSNPASEGDDVSEVRTYNDSSTFLKLGAESTENFSSTLGNQDDRINSNTTKELNADPVTVKNVKEELNASKPQPVTSNPASEGDDVSEVRTYNDSSTFLKLGAESTENFSSTLGNQDDRINSNTTKELNADPVTVKNVKEELNASKLQPVTSNPAIKGLIPVITIVDSDEEEERKPDDVVTLKNVKLDASKPQPVTSNPAIKGLIPVITIVDSDEEDERKPDDVVTLKNVKLDASKLQPVTSNPAIKGLIPVITIVDSDEEDESDEKKKDKACDSNTESIESVEKKHTLIEKTAPVAECESSKRRRETDDEGERRSPKRHAS